MKQLRENELLKDDYTRLGGGILGEQEYGEDVSDESMERLLHYNYFNEEKIRASLNLKPQVEKEGQKNREQKAVELVRVSAGYSNHGEEQIGQAEGRGKTEGKGKAAVRTFPIKLLYTRDKILRAECSCDQCMRTYARYMGNCRCGYVAAMAQMLEEYLKDHPVGDATDMSGRLLLSSFQEKRQNQAETAAARGEILTLAPRLTQKGGELSISFRVGAGRMFVVKDLEAFCGYVKESATAVYGTNTELNHSIENFREESKKWIRYISRIVREEEQFSQRLEESRYYYRQPAAIGGSLKLFGWRLDQFFELLGEDPVEFENKDLAQKGKRFLRTETQNPKVTMEISEQKMRGEREFHGIWVRGTLPELHFGMDTAYYIEEDCLCKVEPEFLKKIEALANLSQQNHFSFRVGRNSLAEFYYRVLPQLEGAVEITETDPKRFRAYLPPQARFVFYLDAEEDDLMCRIRVRYGDREFSALDLARAGQEKSASIEPFRDREREREIVAQVKNWFPVFVSEKDELRCGQNEERIFRVLEQGVNALLELGEVQCTSRFRNHQVIRRVRVSVGVSVSGGLLDLEIGSEDVSREELLNMLKSYRQKRRYFRLRNGSFVNLDNQSLGMAAELAEAMRLSPKEFIKGKMHLPAYRALYLDRLLEENEEVYSSRDKNFRDLVKGFKTIKDSDFKEPESLSGVMRVYQKNGYQWMRTLESWNFGGILADDMGLGKTLQMISVLLAAKEEGQEGTSLIVSPASLVFNWGEEFKRFAPGLRVSLVTGSQEERKRKIEAYKDADVLVTSYDLLKRDIAFYEDCRFSYQVLDEAQYIKNHTTAAAKAVKAVKSCHRFALTGTPIENRLSELWSIFDYLMPGFLYSYEVFRKDFETPIVKNGDETAMERLKKMTGPFILRRLKADVLKDLPDKLEEVRFVQLEDSQRKLYDAQVLHMKEMIARQNEEDFNKSRLQILSELMRLRQLCCDPHLCLENYQGDSAKAEACLELIQSAIDGGHRTLLFSQFTSMLEILQERCEKAGIPYFVITGATPKEKRLQLVKEFNEGEVPVFFISLKAGGVGLNLIGADMVIHYDPWWNLAAQNQATDRTHRIGQTKTVTVYRLIAKNTIEEKIQKLQEMKQNLADQIVSKEAVPLGSMSKEELLALLDGTM